VLVWPRFLIASWWKLCSEGEILFVFSDNVNLLLYPQTFYVLKIFPWTSWKRHIYGYTSSVFKPVLRIFADNSVWPRCLVACRRKLCDGGEMLFVFSENVSLVLQRHTFCFWKNVLNLPIFGRVIDFHWNHNGAWNLFSKKLLWIKTFIRFFEQLQCLVCSVALLEVWSRGKT